MSTAMWKLEKDLCRCCHAEGSFKHLSDPCFLLGQEEIYSVMLQDSLAVKIVPMTGPLSDATYTICESCVVRLRDASNFKRQVQDCEERFKEMYSKNLIRGFDVKEELDSDEDMKQEGIAEDDDDDDDDDDDAFMKFDDDAEADDSFDEHEEMVTVEVPKAKGKRKAKPKPKPKKATPVKKTKTKEKPIKLETEELTEAAVSGEKKKDEEKHNMKACYKCKKIRKIEDLGATRSCPDCATILTDCVVRLVREQLPAGPITNFFITTETTNGQAESVEPQPASSSAGGPAPASSYAEVPAPASVLRDYLLRGSAGDSKEDDDDDSDVVEILDKNDKIERFGCVECNRTFCRKSSLAWHVKRIHRMVPFKCPDCTEGFPTKSKLQIHVKKVHDKNFGPEKDTRYKAFVKVIEGDQPAEKIYACKLCDFKSDRFMGITAHTKVHARRLTCPMCFKFIPDPNEFKAHKAQPHPEYKKFTCLPCNRVYNTILDLGRHKRLFHYKTKCPHCPELLTKRSLAKHMRQFHVENLLTCGICGLKASSSYRLNHHQKLVHLKEKNVVCDICQFPFFSAVELKRHMISHNAEKMYECEYCNKKFARKSTRNLHEKIHTGEKTKICAVCGAAFVQKASLNYHMVKHHPDRV